MKIWYKNLLFLIPCLAVIGLNLAFQSPFLAPQSHKHLETTKKKRMLGQHIPEHSLQSIGLTLFQCCRDKAIPLITIHLGTLIKLEDWRQEFRLQVLTP